MPGTGPGMKIEKKRFDLIGHARSSGARIAPYPPTEKFSWRRVQPVTRPSMKEKIA
jgi:hypothetical protein